MNVNENIDFQLNADPKNCDIYEQKLSSEGPFSTVPRWIYFYYFRINDDGSLVIDHYLYCNGDPDDPKPGDAIQPEQLPGLIQMLANNARPKQHRDPPRVGSNFQNVQWDRVSHIVLFLDELNWSFHRRAEDKTAVVFNVTGGRMPNQSFFDGRDVTISMPIGDTGETDNRTAFAFINHLTSDADGTKLVDGQIHNYKFDIYFDVKYAKGPGSPITVIIDPPTDNGGTTIKT